MGVGEYIEKVVYGYWREFIDEIKFYNELWEKKKKLYFTFIVYHKKNSFKKNSIVKIKKCIKNLKKTFTF